MNRNSIFRRKLIYLVVLLAMVFPLFMLGQPSGGKPGEMGGELSKLRHRYNIAESDLGEISPASETMKLASLGLRGVAATLLWNKAHEYRVTHEWDRLKATLNNIALLQPHFDKVWEHQAHNLAYNVSSEFDDYRQRYEMVREGTEFLTRGVRQNRNAPRLVWYTGWFYGSKMGTADEKVQFRRLFSDDEVLHDDLLKQNIAVDSPEARGPLGKPDNWLVGRLWLNHGYDLVDSGVKIRRQTPLNFFETGPKWRFNHASAIEKEGILDERAQNAWLMSAEDWQKFGNRSIPTTSPFTIKLDQLDELLRQRHEKVEQFVELTGSEAGSITAMQSAAQKTDPNKRLRAVQLVGEIQDLDQRINKTDGYRNQINYAYWKTLAQAEQEERTVKARRLVHEAEKANEDAELDKAIELYEQAFAIWAEIFDDYPILTVDDTARDLFQSIRRYFVAIDSEEIPEDFPLKTFVEMMGQYGEVNADAYIHIREQIEVDAKKRRLELEEEERRREEAALKEAAQEDEDKEMKEGDDEKKKSDVEQKEADDEEMEADGKEQEIDKEEVEVKEQDSETEQSSDEDAAESDD